MSTEVQALVCVVYFLEREQYCFFFYLEVSLHKKKTTVVKKLIVKLKRPILCTNDSFQRHDLNVYLKEMVAL